MSPSFAIGGRVVGPGHPVFVVAELSANHHQDLGTARELVRVAARSGADAVKLQTYTPDTITFNSQSEPFQVGRGTIWAGRTLYELYREAQTPWSWHEELAALATEFGLQWFSSPFDLTAVEFLETLSVPAYKVASFEVVDVPLLRAIAATGKPMIISTGMATFDEISEAVGAVRAVQQVPIALLRTTSAYPAPPGEMHLRTIPYLAQTFDVVTGLSDHTLGIATAVAAVALGASIIEKHLTLSRTEPGPDSAFSLEPREFKALVDAVRVADQALGTVRFGPTEHEEPSLQFRRSLFAVQDIAAGELMTRQNVRSIRPAHGLHPRYLDEVVGRRAACDIPGGTPLTWDLSREAAMLTGATVSVRRALETDRELLFRWANDSLTRANSFEPDPIPWASHCAWFDTVLNDPGRLLYVLLTSGDEPIGQARFDRCGEREATVSMSLGSEWRERALAAPAIRAATERAMNDGGFDVVHAFIKPANEASVRAFTRAGYTERPSTEFKGRPAMHLVSSA